MSGRTLPELEPTLLSCEQMPEPRLVGFAGGAIAIFSSACPDSPEPNEDGALLFPFSAQEAVLAVADGAGGQPAGAEAAAAALEALREAVESARAQGRSLRGGILDGFEAGDRAVRELAVGAATTLAAVEIGPGYLRPYHAGDSSIVVVGQRGRAKLTTVPHSPVGYAVEAGFLEREEALHHEDLNYVSNVLGQEGMRIEVGSTLALAPRDTAILATDGVFDNLRLGEVSDYVRTGPLDRASAALHEACAQRMSRAAAGEPSKPDDATFILYRVRA